MYSDYHLIRLRIVVKSLVLITKPDKLLLTITLADINAKLDKSIINLAVHSVRVSGVAGAFNSNCSLVICITGRAPVSYTHLDVYKRQELPFDEHNPRCGKCGDQKQCRKKGEITLDGK